MAFLQIAIRLFLALACALAARRALMFPSDFADGMAWAVWYGLVSIMPYPQPKASDHQS